MVNGLDLNRFMSNRPGPVQRDTSNPFADLGDLGLAIARGRHQTEAEDLARQHQSSQEELARVGQQQNARQMLSNDRHADQREALYSKQEDRRESQAQFERSKLADAQHESMLHDLYAATTSNDPRAIQYAIDQLHRAGYQTEQMEHSADPVGQPGGSAPAQAPEYDPTLGGTLLPDDSPTTKPPLPGQSAMPRKRADAQTSKELDSVESSYLSKLQKKPSGVDAQTSKELDAIEADYLPKLQGDGGAPARKRFLPGQQIILGAGDSYNKL